MRIEVLKVAASKSPQAFRFVTFGFIDLMEFKRTHMDEVSEDEITSEESFGAPQADKLRGFKFEGRTQEDQNETAKPLKNKTEDDENFMPGGDKGMNAPSHQTVDHNDVIFSMNGSIRNSRRDSEDASGGSRRSVVDHDDIGVSVFEKKDRFGTAQQIK